MKPCLGNDGDDNVLLVVVVVVILTIIHIPSYPSTLQSCNSRARHSGYQIIAPTINVHTRENNGNHPR